MRKVLIVVVMLVFAVAGCSSVYKNFSFKGYSPTGKGAVKRIAISVTTCPGPVGLQPMVARITRDLLRTNRNYLVYSIVETPGDAQEECRDKEGLVEIVVNSCSVSGDSAKVDITARLIRCSDRKVLWSASAKRFEKSSNSSLKNITNDYAKSYGRTARTFAAPLFNVLEDLVEVLPNPELTEEEVEEKIELEISRESSASSEFASHIFQQR